MCRCVRNCQKKLSNESVKRNKKLFILLVQFNLRKLLPEGTLAVYKEYAAGIVPANTEYSAGTVPENKEYAAG